MECFEDGTRLAPDAYIKGAKCEHSSTQPVVQAFSLFISVVNIHQLLSFYHSRLQEANDLSHLVTSVPNKSTWRTVNTVYICHPLPGHKPHISNINEAQWREASGFTPLIKVRNSNADQLDE